MFDLSFMVRVVELGMGTFMTSHTCGRVVNFYPIPDNLQVTVRSVVSSMYKVAFGRSLFIRI